MPAEGRKDLKAEAGDFLAESRNVPHECNAYCRGDVHAMILWCDGDTLPPGTTAILSGRRRWNIVDIKPAPEVPPIDPSDPDRREWSHRFVVWSRECTPSERSSLEARS